MGSTEDATATEFDAPPNEPTTLTRRWLAAPRERVFAAFTDPKQLRRWWGGRRDSTLSECSVDFRVGGRWRFVERSGEDDGVAFSGVYRDIRPPERLVYTMVCELEAFKHVESVVVVTFVSERNGTRLTVASRFPDLAGRKLYTDAGAEQGARVLFERLADLLYAQGTAGGAPDGSDR